VQVAAEDGGQSRGLLLDGLFGWPLLVEPADLELVTLPRVAYDGTQYFALGRSPAGEMVKDSPRP